MNEWIRNSINLANNSNYLDRLFEIYPTIPNQPRKISKEKWYNIEVAYNNRDDRSLLTHLLYLDLFPIKDSYVAFLKKNKHSLDKNPETCKRLCSLLYEAGLDKIFELCSQPKETNRQIGRLI